MNSLVLESVVLLGLQGALFFGCRKYVLRSLYSDLQALSTSKPALPSPTSASAPNDLPHSALARSVFALSFTESCTLFILLMAQALDLFAPATRLLHWRLSLALLMGTILVLAPLALSLLLLRRAALSVPPVALFLAALSQVPLPAALADTSPAAAALARLVVLGTLVLGLLSGFGAAATVWAYRPRAGGAPTDGDVAAADHALQTVRGDLRKRTAEAPQAQAGWIARFRGGDGQSQELQGLQALEHQMTRNLDALRQRRESARYAKSLRGRILNFGGRIFAIYCLIRILNSLLNLLRPVAHAQRSAPARNNTDAITDLLAYVLALVAPGGVEREAVASFSRQLSLGLVGLIILTNIRLVLRGVTRVLRVTSRNRGASVMLLLLAQLMGIYLLTTIVQLRTSFPPPLASAVPAPGPVPTAPAAAAVPTTATAPGLDPVRADGVLRPGLDPVHAPPVPRATTTMTTTTTTTTTPDTDPTTTTPGPDPDPTPADPTDPATSQGAAETNLFATIPEFEVFGALFDGAFVLAAGGTAFWRWGRERVDGVGGD